MIHFVVLLVMEAKWKKNEVKGKLLLNCTINVQNNRQIVKPVGRSWKTGQTIIHNIAKGGIITSKPRSGRSAKLVQREVRSVVFLVKTNVRVTDRWPLMLCKSSKSPYAFPSPEELWRNQGSTDVLLVKNITPWITDKNVLL